MDVIILVNGGRAGDFPTELKAMHRLRARVFSGRLGWEVEVADEEERDVFDALQPDYLIQRAPSGAITGCVRMLPSTGPNMLRDVFPQLAGPTPIPASPMIREASRYCVDHAAAGGTSNGLRQMTYELFAGMVEYGLVYGLSDVLAVTDLRMERILARAGWSLRRFAPPRQVGVTEAVAGTLEVSRESLQAIRDRGGLTGPALWMPFSDAEAA
jgi:acyl homoserine lactone synthase